MLYGIGVGVGNSDNLTKKAIDILRNIDILYVPLAKKNEEHSTAYEIVRPYIKDTTIIKSRYFPMNYNTIELQNSWKNISQEIEQDVLRGNEVGFVTIGDPMVYSTYIYLLRLLKNKIEIKTIAGITSFLDVAANNNFPLVEGDNPLVVLPATMGIDKLRPYIRNEKSIVLMKVYKNFNEIINLLKEENLEKCSLVVINSSKDEELIYKDITKVDREYISYYTTILINKEWEI